MKIHSLRVTCSLFCCFLMLLSVKAFPKHKEVDRQYAKPTSFVNVKTEIVNKNNITKPRIWKSPYKRKTVIAQEAILSTFKSPYAKIPNEHKIAAFLDTISFAEGAGYKTHYGFKNHLFNPKKKFPCRVVSAGGFSSSACGRYQVMNFTYKRLQKKLKLKGFSSYEQDQIAIKLIKERGAYRNILRGEIQQAIIKCSPEWASFDSGNGRSYYRGQRAKKMKTLLKVYKQSLERRLS